MRLAAADSLLYPLQELQDRVSLEVPATYIKEEGIRESADQQVAKYTIIYYLTEDDEPDGDELNIKSIIDRLARDVLDTYPIEWEAQHTNRNRNTYQTVVTLRWPNEKRQASVRRHADEELMTVLPITTYVGDDVYNLTTDGQSFFILKNGDAVVEAPSPAYAVGSLLSILRAILPDLEFAQNLPKSPPHDFLAGAAMGIVDSPELSDAAKEHFVKFYEMVTLKDGDVALGNSDDNLES